MHAFPSSHAVVVGAAAATQHPAEHVLIMQGAEGGRQSPSFAHTLGEHPPELDALDALDALDVELLDAELLGVELLDVLDVELLDVADTVELLDAVAPAIPAAPPPPPLAPPVPKRTESVPQAGMAHSAPSQSRMINIA